MYSNFFVIIWISVSVFTNQVHAFDAPLVEETPAHDSVTVLGKPIAKSKEELLAELEAFKEKELNSLLNEEMLKNDPALLKKIIDPWLSFFKEESIEFIQAELDLLQETFEGQEERQIALYLDANTADSCLKGWELTRKELNEAIWADKKNPALDIARLERLIESAEYGLENDIQRAKKDIRRSLRIIEKKLKRNELPQNEADLLNEQGTRLMKTLQQLGPNIYMINDYKRYLKNTESEIARSTSLNEIDANEIDALQQRKQQLIATIELEETFLSCNPPQRLPKGQSSEKVTQMTQLLEHTWWENQLSKTFRDLQISYERPFELESGVLPRKSEFLWTDDQYSD